MNNIRNKLLALGAASVLALPLLTGLPSISSAQDNGRDEMMRSNNMNTMMRDRNDYMNYRNRDVYMQHYRRDGNDRMFLHYNHPMAKIRVDRDYLIRNNDVGRYFRMRGYSAGDFNARNIVLVDRAYPNNYIYLQNAVTGPFSTNINRVDLYVDHDFFTRARDTLSVDQNIDIDVNTGNNTVSMNTIAGDLITGDVNIAIRQF